MDMFTSIFRTAYAVRPCLYLCDNATSTWQCNLIFLYPSVEMLRHEPQALGCIGYCIKLSQSRLHPVEHVTSTSLHGQSHVLESYRGSLDGKPPAATGFNWQCLLQHYFMNCPRSPHHSLHRILNCFLPYQLLYRYSSRHHVSLPPLSGLCHITIEPTIPCDRERHKVPAGFCQWRCKDFSCLPPHIQPQSLR